MSSLICFIKAIWHLIPYLCAIARERILLYIKSRFFLCRNFVKLMIVQNSDVNLMSLKTSSKYLSVHFFRLCRALSLSRIHKTRNVMAILQHSQVKEQHDPVCLQNILRVVHVFEGYVFVEIHFTGVSPRDKTIG